MTGEPKKKHLIFVYQNNGKIDSSDCLTYEEFTEETLEDIILSGKIKNLVCTIPLDLMVEFMAEFSQTL
jgi:hypothetical protein